MASAFFLALNLVVYFSKSRQSRCHVDSLRLASSYGKKSVSVIRQHNFTFSSGFRHCTKALELPAKLVAVDGGGTQVKVLLLPMESSDAPQVDVESLLHLNHCVTDETTLKDMLKKHELLIPTDGDGQQHLPVTGGLGDRLSREEGFQHIVEPVGEFEAIVAGVVAQHRHGGLRSYGVHRDEMPDVPDPPSDAEDATILVDTYYDSISLVKWERGDSGKRKAKATTLQRLDIGLSMFKAEFKRIVKIINNKRLQLKNQAIKKKSMYQNISWDAGLLQRIYSNAAHMVKERLKLNTKEAGLRNDLVRSQEALSALERESVPARDSRVQDLRAEVTRIEAALSDLYPMLRPFVSSAHKLIEEIYPNGIGTLGPLASACFMAHASRCLWRTKPRRGKDLSAALLSEQETGLVNYVVGFLEMVVVNTIQIANLWKKMLNVRRVAYVGKLVHASDELGKISYQFFQFRLSADRPMMVPLGRRLLLNEIPDGVWLDDLTLKSTPFHEMRLLDRESDKRPRVSCGYSELEHPLSAPSFIVASLGTGVPIARVDSGIYSGKVGGSAVGGGTFWGLLKVVHPGADFGTVVDLAATGGHMGHGGDTLGGDAQRKISLIAINIAVVVSLTALSQHLKTAVFIGGFMTENKLAEKLIAHVCASFGVEAVFEKQLYGVGYPRPIVRPRGFVGAFGAFIIQRSLTSSFEALAR